MHELVLAHPWTAAAGVCVALCALLALFGVPLATAWLLLAIGLVGTLAVRGWHQYGHSGRAPEIPSAESDRAESPPSERKHFWQEKYGFVRVTCIFVIWVVFFHDRGKDTPAPDWFEEQSAMTVPAGALSSSSANQGPTDAYVAQHERRAARTRDYWNTTVAALHGYRFDEVLSDEPAELFFERLRNDYEAAVQRARQQSTQDVEPDLVSMVQQHLDVDEALLAWVRDVLESSAEPWPDHGLSAREHMQLFYDHLTRMNDAEWAALPPWRRRLLEQLVQLVEWREGQYEEIKAMQSRLVERFPGSAYSLPELKVMDPGAESLDNDRV